jgi:hypothetical protein
VIFIDIGGIVDHFSMSWSEGWLLNHLLPKLIEWWSTIPPILTKITSHFNSLSDGQQFHQYQDERWFLLILVELLTITEWVKVRGDVCWYWWNCWPSLNELRWEVIFVDIGGIVDHHSMNWGERWFLLILVELFTITQWVKMRQFHQYQKTPPLTLTHWVMVNNSTNINKNHLSPQFIEWWSTILVDHH